MGGECNMDFQYCEDIIKQHSSSFYHAFKHLPEQDRNAVFALYAFCRIADDSIDVDRDLNKLETIASNLRQTFDGVVVEEPIFACLREVLKNYPLPIQPFEDLITGMKADYYHKVIVSDDDLTLYCYQVAGTVGLMLNPILASRRYEKNKELLGEVAIQLGYAMQITNILRDVGQDFASGRLYLPQELLLKYGVTIEEVILGDITPGYQELVENYIEQANRAYAFLEKHICLYNKDARASVYLAAKFYQAILQEIRKGQYDNITKRHFVSDSKKKWLYLYYKLRLWIRGVCLWH